MLSINLEGKKGLVLGVANQRSIGWAIAENWEQPGPGIHFSFQGDKLKEAGEKFKSSPI